MRLDTENTVLYNEIKNNYSDYQYTMSFSIESEDSFVDLLDGVKSFKMYADAQVNGKMNGRFVTFKYEVEIDAKYEQYVLKDNALFRPNIVVVQNDEYIYSIPLTVNKIKRDTVEYNQKSRTISFECVSQVEDDLNAIVNTDAEREYLSDIWGGINTFLTWIKYNYYEQIKYSGKFNDLEQLQYEDFDIEDTYKFSRWNGKTNRSIVEDFMILLNNFVIDYGDYHIIKTLNNRESVNLIELKDVTVSKNQLLDNNGLEKIILALQKGVEGEGSESIINALGKDTFTIYDNQVVWSAEHKEKMVDSVKWNYNDFRYTPFSLTTKLHPFVEIGDEVTFDITEEVWNETTQQYDRVIRTVTSIVMQYELVFNGSVMMSLGAKPYEDKPIQVSRVSPIINAIRETEIKVDKAIGEITSAVSNHTEEIQQLTEWKQTADTLLINIGNGGGSNIMTNSVGFKGITDRWFIRTGLPEHIKTEAGNTWILGNSISKHGFVFSGDVTLQYELKDLLVEGREYSFVFTLNKPLGTTFVYSIDEHSAYAHGPYSLSPTESYDGKITINFVANGQEDVVSFSSTNNAVITDIGIYEGSNAVGWQQASGEMHTLDVQIDKDGIKIYSDESRTAWTIMSPNEFAKYYGNESVFSLNEDITNVMGLQVNGKGLYVAPIKFVQNLNANPISLDIVWTGKGDN